MIGAAFVILMIKLYRDKHPKGGSSTGSSSSGKSKFGGGGLNDMMGMGKSNV